MMTKEEVRAWCYQHFDMKSRLEINTDHYAKTVFENGDVYEFEYTDTKPLFKPYQIKINGKIVLQGVQQPI